MRTGAGCLKFLVPGVITLQRIVPAACTIGRLDLASTPGVKTMPKYVVLGANSFSGQDFVDLLLDDTARQAIGVSRSPERSSLFLRYKYRTNLSGYRYVQLDLNHQLEE